MLSWDRFGRLRDFAFPQSDSMTQVAQDSDIHIALDPATRCLVRLAALIAAGSEIAVREAMHDAVSLPLSAVWVDEVILQSYLFAGFPRALNAAREWRRISGEPAALEDIDADATREGVPEEWRARGAATCERVYGGMYPALRANIAALHPALEHWMVIDGYGKVLSRPGLDLIHRELCIVATCAIAAQDRQLHSHFHGALNVGATVDQIVGTLDALLDLIDQDAMRRYRMLWNHVRRAHQASGQA
jgi:4-carboxymuconolactone decarboxylase